MADVWEIRHFGGTNEIDGGAADDKDGDGLSNVEEYIAGTNPTNNASLFKLDIQDAAGTNGTVVIVWWAPQVDALDAAYGDLRRYYSLESSDDLLQPWDPVPGWTNIPAADSMLRYTNPPAAQIEFYRGNSTLQ